MKDSFIGENKWFWLAGAVAVGLLIVYLAYIMGYSFGALMAKLF